MMTACTLVENPKDSVLRRYAPSFEDSVFLPLNDNSIIERGTAEEEPEADTLEAEHAVEEHLLEGRIRLGEQQIGVVMSVLKQSVSHSVVVLAPLAAAPDTVVPSKPFGPLTLCHVLAALAVHLVNKAPKEHLDVREPSHPGNVG
jgi:hypothetical protein